jgi:hypothetical protein
VARIRSIHPGLFSDPEFAGLSDAAQIFYLGLLTEADDNGVFEWKPATLRIRLRPCKDGAIEPLLSELQAGDKVRPYEIGGRVYGAIRNFRKFQRPKLPKSWHPIPDDFRSYVGLDDPDSPKRGRGRPSSLGTSEIKSQMEDEGWRMKDGSVPNGTGARAPAKDVIFAESLPWLNGRAGKDCRALVGKWLSEVRDDDAVLQLLQSAEQENPVDPVGWIASRLKPRETPDDKRMRENRRVIAEQLAKITGKGVAA